MTRRAILLAVVTLSIGAPMVSVAAPFANRQYYGAWQKSQRGFHFRPYYYKPTPNFVGFRHHFVIHTPSRPKHLFFYNPRSKKFWGRCPTETNGKAAYSLLAEKDRKGDLAEIPESAFPEPGELPPVPDSSDGLLLDLPPDDLPASTSLPE